MPAMPGGAGRGCSALLVTGLVLALVAAATAAPPARAEESPFVKDAKAAKAFCADPGFKKLKCGLASQKEQDLTTKNQCPFCGTRYEVMPRSLPASITGVARYSQLWIDVASLACKGRVVVRSVFKVVYVPDDQAGYYVKRNCSSFILDQGEGAATASSPIVRCELEFERMDSDEAYAATNRGRETKCWVCSHCSNKGGCPNRLGKWYSDTFTMDARGCAGLDASPEGLPGYWATRVGISIIPLTEVQLAKFEVCGLDSPGCFNQAAEAAKLARAKKCVNGVCEKQ